MKNQINHKGIFLAGCTLMAAGIIFLITFPFISINILGAGMALTAIGLAKRGEWDQED